METFLEILKYTLPSLIILAALYLLFRQYLKLDQQRIEGELNKQNREKSMMIRLQACERLILYLERIHPVQLVFRLNKPGIELNSYKNALLNTIKEEYEHNLAQQIYVSEASWEMLVNAKEELIRTVNTAFLNLEDGSDSSTFARKVIEMWMSVEKDPILTARTLIKKDAAQLF